MHDVPNDFDVVYFNLSISMNCLESCQPSGNLQWTWNSFYQPHDQQVKKFKFYL